MISSRRFAQRGVGLIEVLVAVLILSIGLLGLAGLQMRTLRDNQSALDRSMAVTQTHAIADAMRADLAVATTSPGYDIAMGAAAPAGSTFRAVVLQEWRVNLVSALGAGATGSVDCDGHVCMIRVRWDDSRASAGSTTHEVSTQVYL